MVGESDSPPADILLDDFFLPSVKLSFRMFITAFTNEVDLFFQTEPFASNGSPIGRARSRCI